MLKGIILDYYSLPHIVRPLKGIMICRFFHLDWFIPNCMNYPYFDENNEVMCHEIVSSFFFVAQFELYNCWVKFCGN